MLRPQSATTLLKLGWQSEGKRPTQMCVWGGCYYKLCTVWTGQRNPRWHPFTMNANWHFSSLASYIVFLSLFSDTGDWTHLCSHHISVSAFIRLSLLAQFYITEVISNPQSFRPQGRRVVSLLGWSKMVHTVLTNRERKTNIPFIHTRKKI